VEHSVAQYHVEYYTDVSLWRQNRKRGASGYIVTFRVKLNTVRQVDKIYSMTSELTLQSSSRRSRSSTSKEHALTRFIAVSMVGTRRGTEGDPREGYVRQI
jgi:hypothetical protein